MRSSFSGLLLLAVCVASAWSAPTKDSSCIVKEIVIPPRNWVQHSAAPSNHNIILRIGLAQPNFHLLEKHLYEVSDPRNKRYGSHLSKAEVDELVAPHQESIDLVNQWLGSYGFGESDLTRSSSNDWVTLKVPISAAEEMLGTKYSVWQHAESGESIVRTTSYSLPQHLHAHVDVIQPTTMFSKMTPAGSSLRLGGDFDAQQLAKASTLPPILDAVSGSLVDASCNLMITVDCLLQLYNAVGYKAAVNVNNSVGITGYLDEIANRQDLQQFYTDQRPDAINSSFNYVSVKNGLDDQNPLKAGLEAGLDVQFAFGLTYPVSGTFYSTGGSPPYIPDVQTDVNSNEPYMDWLDFVLAQDSVPYTISTSYADHEQTVPDSYARRVCASFAQLGARGVSLIFASGDAGVGDGNRDAATQKCFTNDGRNATRFLPFFPASCPYITSVGATAGIPEVASSSFFSGGGFSEYFDRPSYQDEAVKAFLETLPEGTYKDLFNANGRGYPDVSAQGERFRMYWRGVATPVKGTSASSPTFAGFVTLLNDARFRNGQPPLGFLNPMLYTSGLAGLNDITEGKNPGCGTQGFNATKGWDPVTGLGTPNFGKLKEIVIFSY